MAKKAEEKPRVLILTGSRSDLPDIERDAKVLGDFKVPFMIEVASAHRTPVEVERIVKDRVKGGVLVIIAAAGLANHLAGAVAARTVCPVIGVPLARSMLGGLDSLLSTVQMPPGVPVATVGIGAVENACLLAVQILALRDPRLKARLLAHRKNMRRVVLCG